MPNSALLPEHPRFGPLHDSRSHSSSHRANWSIRDDGYGTYAYGRACEFFLRGCNISMQWVSAECNDQLCARVCYSLVPNLVRNVCVDSTEMPVASLVNWRQFFRENTGNAQAISGHARASGWCPPHSHTMVLRKQQTRFCFARICFRWLC